MNDELQHLKNLGKTSAQWLHAVGIHSASDLRRHGAVSAYRAVKARGFRASKVLLYAIEGRCSMCTGMNCRRHSRPN